MAARRRKSRSWYRRPGHLQPGAPPGTLRADPGARAPAIHVMAYGPERLVEHPNVRPADLPALLAKGDPVVWVNVDGLGDADTVKALGEVFRLHSLALEDVLTVTQRPKVEPYHDHLYIVARMVGWSEGFCSEQVSIFVGPRFVLTFLEDPGDVFSSVRERIRTGRGQLRSSGPGYLAYALLDAIVDGYFPLLERFGEQLESMDEAVIGQPAPQMIDEIRAVRRELLLLRRAVWPLRETINALVRDPCEVIDAETRIHLRDVYDHTIQVVELLENYRELASGLTDTYLSSVSNRMNEVMKVLTVISTIFIPLTFIAGLYGMNFNTAASPWNMPELDWAWGYPACLAVQATIAGSLLIYFRRKGWIGTRRRAAGRPDGNKPNCANTVRTP